MSSHQASGTSPPRYSSFGLVPTIILGIIAVIVAAVVLFALGKICLSASCQETEKNGNNERLPIVTLESPKSRLELTPISTPTPTPTPTPTMLMVPLSPTPNDD